MSKLDIPCRNKTYHVQFGHTMSSVIDMVCPCQVVCSLEDMVCPLDDIVLTWYALNKTYHVVVQIVDIPC